MGTPEGRLGTNPEERRGWVEGWEGRRVEIASRQTDKKPSPHLSLPLQLLLSAPFSLLPTQLPFITLPLPPFHVCWSPPPPGSFSPIPIPWHRRRRRKKLPTAAHSPTHPTTTLHTHFLLPFGVVAIEGKRDLTHPSSLFPPRPRDQKMDPKSRLKSLQSSVFLSAPFSPQEAA